MLDIPPAKMGLYRLSRDFQFGVCNLGEPRRASPYLAREGEHFYRKEKEVERTVAKKKKKKKKKRKRPEWQRKKKNNKKKKKERTR